MSNFATARDAIEADLNHAREGIAFYMKRIAVLEGIREEVARLDYAPATSGTDNKQPGRKPRAGKKTPEPTRKTTRSDAGNALPSTSAQFWTGLLGKTPISNKEMLAAAFSALKIEPTPAQSARMKQRVANAIVNLTRAGTMQSTGKGRDRRFSLKG